MPKIEIEEEQLASLQNTARTVQAMLQNPKTRRRVLEAYKEAVPTASVPEIEATAPYDEKIAGLEKTVTEFIKEMKDSRDKEKTDAEVERLRAQVEAGHKMLLERGYTADGIKLVDEFRDRKGLVDYDDAIRLWELDHPAPQVSEPGDMRNMALVDAMHADAEKNDFYKRLWESNGEDSGAVDRNVSSILSELRGASRR